jgi:hypothetical protein
MANVAAVDEQIVAHALMRAAFHTRMNALRPSREIDARKTAQQNQ